MTRSVFQHMSRLAAILAVALLCAQTLVVIHDHQISEHELCAVCSTTAEHADTPDLTASESTWTESALLPAFTSAPPVAAVQANHRARAPPIA